MLKKFKCILALFLVIILFAGCAQKETPYISNEYVLEYENDKCYMSFKGERKVENDLSDCEAVGLYFTSLDELKDTIINKKFTDKQLAMIRRDFVNKDTKKIQICNPNKLYQAVCPENLELGYFYWKGLTYSWLFNRTKIRGEEFSYITKDKYDERLQDVYYEFYKQEELIETQKIDDRNATVYYYMTSYGKQKRVCYVLEQGEKTLHIAEEHVLDNTTNDTEYIVIRIIGKQNEEHFYVNLIVDDRPSEEYLLEFGLREI